MELHELSTIFPLEHDRYRGRIIGFGPTTSILKQHNTESVCHTCSRSSRPSIICEKIMELKERSRHGIDLVLRPLTAHTAHCCRGFCDRSCYPGIVDHLMDLEYFERKKRYLTAISTRLVDATRHQPTVRPFAPHYRVQHSPNIDPHSNNISPA
jgi:hypothetical protein